MFAPQPVPQYESFKSSRLIWIERKSTACSVAREFQCRGQIVSEVRIVAILIDVQQREQRPPGGVIGPALNCPLHALVHRRVPVSGSRGTVGIILRGAGVSFRVVWRTSAVLVGAEDCATRLGER